MAEAEDWDDADFARAVVEWISSLSPPPAACSSIQIEDGLAVAVIEPANEDPCSVKVGYDPDAEAIFIFVGSDGIPIEASLIEPVTAEHWPDACDWISRYASAVFEGRYEQEWTTLRDGSLVMITGIFCFNDGVDRHYYRPRFGWFRRKRRRRVVCAP